MAALVPLPVAARESQPAASVKKTTAPSLRQVVAQEAARTPLQPAVARASERASTTRTVTQDDSPKQSKAFFKTPLGIAALAVMVAGTGYAIYSAKHDRIKSPGKQ
jgi:hypothetical protein